MHREEKKTVHSTFLTKFCKPSHSYSRPVILEQHFDSSRKNPRKSSTIPDNYKEKTSFNGK